MHPAYFRHLPYEGMNYSLKEPCSLCWLQQKLRADSKLSDWLNQSEWNTPPSCIHWEKSWYQNDFTWVQIPGSIEPRADGAAVQTKHWWCFFRGREPNSSQLNDEYHETILFHQRQHSENPPELLETTFKAHGKCWENFNVSLGNCFSLKCASQRGKHYLIARRGENMNLV